MLWRVADLLLLMPYHLKSGVIAAADLAYRRIVERNESVV